MFKKFLLIIGLFTIFNQSVETFAEIIPLKKPIQSIKEKEQKLLVDVLKPLQKPSTKTVIENQQKQPNYKKVTKQKSNRFMYKRKQWKNSSNCWDGVKLNRRGYLFNHTCGKSRS